MLTKEAITAINEGEAIRAAHEALPVESVTALPSDFKLHDLEPFYPVRRRLRGAMETNSISAFQEYTKVNAQTGCTVFVDAARMVATSILNHGTSDVPGHADYSATLTLDRTAAYKALQATANGAGFSQAAIAEFFEDWPDALRFFNDAGEISGPKAIAAIRRLTIESMRKLESTEQQLSASRSAFESVQATSADPIPTIVYFNCQPYADLETRTFIARLTIKTGDAKPTVALRISKAEEHAEEMALELGALITTAFVDQKIPVLIGKFRAS